MEWRDTHRRIVAFGTLILVLTLNGLVVAQYGGGSGTPDAPYLIYTPQQMNAIGADPNDWDKHFQLRADLDRAHYTGTEFNMIGAGGEFSGVFDGNGHTISNFTRTSGTRNVGLFACVSGSDAEVKNLGVVDCYIDARSADYVGALVGTFQAGRITHCHSSGTVNGEYGVGGLVGLHYGDGIITGCYSTCAVSTSEYSAGGLIGAHRFGTVTNCYATGVVTGVYEIGGLVGHTDGGTFTHNYAIATVQGRGSVGGLLGNVYSGTVAYCYAAGPVTGDEKVGGLIGSGSYRTAFASFWDIEASGQTHSNGGRGRTTEQMYDGTTFLSWGACGTREMWTLDEGRDYPRLAWEDRPGQRLAAVQLSDFLTGAGTASRPFTIQTADDLQAIGLFPCEWDKHFVLEADIDMSEYTGSDFNVIGAIGAFPFSGVFDGKGHTIMNFQYVSDGATYLGLFGYVAGANAQIKGLGLIDVKIDGGKSCYAGALVAYLRQGSVSHCYADGGMVSGDVRAGGLIGTNNGVVTNCYCQCDVLSDDAVGTSLTPREGPPMERAVNFRLRPRYYAGGLVGQNTGIITNCYSTGRVYGGESPGGLIGSGSNNVVASFWDIETSGRLDSSAGLGKTTAEMQQAETFATWGLCGNENIWTIDEGRDYPRLRWQDEPGDLIAEPPLEAILAGDGSMDNPFLIYTAEEMNLIGQYPCQWGQTFKLMADIDLAQFTGNQFHLIGIPGQPFAGVFDGNGHTISNFTCSASEDAYVGLFRYISDPNAEIRNLYLVTPDIQVAASNYVGVLAGYLRDGAIVNCGVYGGQIAGDSDVGGLLGQVFGGTVTGCSASTRVEGDTYTGGLIGRNRYDGVVDNCYATGSVEGRESTGGLIGNNYEAIVLRCYSSGPVAGETDIGGLIGSSHIDAVVASFWDVQTSGQTTSAGGTGKTTTELQTTSTFLGWAACDSAGIWTIADGADYPRLWWEQQPGQFLPPTELSDVLLGTGAEDDPFLIFTPEELNCIALFPCQWDRHFQLMADLDLAAYAGTSFNIIGPYALPFTGVFEGNGYVITNFNYAATHRSHVGLFGRVAGKGEIRNLHLVDCHVVAEAGDCIGALVSFLDDEATVSNCSSKRGTVAGNRTVGGLVGRNHGVIRGSCAIGNVVGDWWVGGLVGTNYSAVITDSYVSGTVTGEDHVGGLVGRNDNHATIVHCYATSIPTGRWGAGGFVEDNQATVLQCFWDVEASGLVESDGGMGLTTAEMQMASTFLEAGWDFVGEEANGTKEIWWIDEGQDYPRLRWEAEL